MKFILVSSENGLYDFDVIDCQYIRRVTVSEKVEKGDTFNIYSGESHKSDGIWSGTKGIKGYLTGDLEASVRASNAFHSELIKRDADFVTKSDYVVYVTTSESMVEMKHDSQDDSLYVTLFNDDADRFIEEATKLFEDLGDITMEEAYLHLSKPYIESVFS